MTNQLRINIDWSNVPAQMRPDIERSIQRVMNDPQTRADLSAGYDQINIRFAERGARGRIRPLPERPGALSQPVRRLADAGADRAGPQAGRFGACGGGETAQYPARFSAASTARYSSRVAGGWGGRTASQVSCPRITSAALSRAVARPPGGSR